jgi:lysophospholipase
VTRREVFVLYTGGTIGMMPSPRGYVPTPGFLARHLEAMPQFHEHGQEALTTPPNRTGTGIHYHIEEWDTLLDSANVDMDDWVRIAETIERRHAEFDGFVVLHGTDTMAYTASALSFMLENLDKPVVLTGAQIPLSNVRSDGVDNLLGALAIAGHFHIPEVTLYFADRLFRGNRVRKVDTRSFAAFESGNHPPLAEVGVDITVDWDRILSAPDEPLRLRPIVNRNVAALRLFPGITAEIVTNFLRPPLEGLVIETYGSGNAPDDRKDLLDALRAAIERGVVVVNCTQCLRGRVRSDYATGTALGEVGVLSGADMTPEAALTKLAWLLGQGLDRKTLAARIGENLRGELQR